jgi:gliding motility-associated lipoprotein GldH
MKSAFCLMLLTLLVISCNSNRVYEDNVDFKDRTWKIAEPAKFDFQISDTTKKYNLLIDIRNSLDYPYARLFINYELKKDTTSLSKDMVSFFLFDQKTGKPFGSSSIGDIYDHQFSILKNYHFKKTGSYQMNFQQFMRMDTIPGVLAVGLRVEEAIGK